VLTFTPPDTSGVLVDGVAPTITSVAGPAAGTYIVGQHLDFTVVFSEAVAVTGTPRLQLTIGSATRYATYLSGTGSTLTFRYTVQSGDLDTDGIAVASPIDLNGGTIKDVPGNDAVLIFTPPNTTSVLVDGVAPTITSVAGPAAGTYIVGQNLDFSVQFSEAVVVNTAGGTPRLVLTIGSTTRYATYLSGTGSSTLIFRYTVQAGDEDTNGIAVASPIDLNGGTIKDTNGNDAVLTFTPPDTSSVLVDGVAPTITSVTGPAAGTYIVGQNLDFTVVFSEAVAVTGTPRLVLTIGSTTRYATYLSGTGTSTLTFRYTVQSGDLDTDGIAVASTSIGLNGGTITDVPGNDAVLIFTPPITSGVLVDGVAPTITSVSGPAAGTYIVGQNLDFTVQFDDTVNVTGTPRLVLTIGSATRYATYVSGSGSASLLFRYTVQAGDLDSDGIAVASTSIDLNNGAITDVPGNNAVLSFTPPNTSSVLVDGVAPTVVQVVRGRLNNTYIVGQHLDFTVQFDDTVNVTGTPRLVLTIGSTTRYATYVSGSGSASLLFRYTVQSGDLDSDGIAVASPIDLNGGTITDVPGNDAVLTFTPPNTSGVLVDGVAPTITSVTGPAAGTYIVGQNLDFTVVFSEAVAVTGTPRLVLTIGSTTQYATYLSGSGSMLTFRYTVQSGDLDSDGIAVASPIDLNGGTIKDVPGNNAVLTFTPPITSGVLVDGVAPTITSVKRAGCRHLHRRAEPRFHRAVQRSGGSEHRRWHTAAATDHRQHHSLCHLRLRQRFGEVSLFRYTVQAGDLDTDGIAVASPIGLNGGTIRDVPGNNAVLSFMPPNTSGVLVDGVAPTITSVAGPAAGTYIVGQNLDFTVVFSEAVVVTGTPRLVLTIGSTTRYATYLSGSVRQAHCLPLHGASGRPGQRWHRRCIAD
jgi:hypothetical protein